MKLKSITHAFCIITTLLATTDLSVTTVYSQTPADFDAIYATTGGVDGGRLRLIDQDTLAATDIGKLTANIDRAPAVAINPSGDIYAITLENAYGTQSLTRIDAATGACTVIGA